MYLLAGNRIVLVAATDVSTDRTARLLWAARALW
jgi:hypothetical protein